MDFSAPTLVHLRTKESETQRGFTLIEALIGILILGLVFTVGFANYRGFATRQKLDAVRRFVEADLRLAQGQAVAGKKPKDASGVVVPECRYDPVNGLYEEIIGYRFIWAGDTIYTIQAECTGGTIDIKTFDVSTYYENVVISNFSVIRFNALAEGVDISSPVNITITDNTTMTSTTITVTRGGEIN